MIKGLILLIFFYKNNQCFPTVVSSNSVNNFKIHVYEQGLTSISCNNNNQWHRQTNRNGWAHLSVHAVWGRNGTLVSLEMALWGCTALWYWIKTCTVNFLSFKPVLRPEWPIIWPNLSPNVSLSLPFQFFEQP